jgi:hypothetical protein
VCVSVCVCVCVCVCVSEGAYLHLRVCTGRELHCLVRKCARNHVNNASGVY